VLLCYRLVFISIKTNTYCIGRCWTTINWSLTGMGASEWNLI